MRRDHLKKVITMLNGTVHVDGAELYYEICGQGPALLMISGAGGDAGYYSESARILENSFTVISYDRRGNSRSTGRRDTKTSMREQARDAKALIDELAGGRALVFGNSGGAIIGLELTAAFPASVQGLIAHEPPILGVLPDGDPDRGFFAEILAVAEQHGVMAAGARFVQSVRGEGTYPWPTDVHERFLGNVTHLFTNEFAAFGDYTPDWGALGAAGVPIVMAAGSEDRGCNYFLPSIIIAEQLGLPWAEFPGYHLPFMERPREFAAALRAVATQMFSNAETVAPLWRGSAALT
jgi:pimeloyl-ACP methyl ester carboxylesterase